MLESLELFSPAGSLAEGVLLQDIQVAPAEAPAVIRRCTIRAGHDGVHIASKFASCSGVRIEENLVQQGERGIWVGGTVRRVQVTGNRVLDCLYADLQIENLHPTAGQILMANNTAGRGNVGFRYWLDQGADDPVLGQAEVRNNLLFGTTVYDMGFERPNADIRPGSETGLFG
jgi:hypothetical protein